MISAFLFGRTFGCDRCLMKENRMNYVDLFFVDWMKLIEIVLYFCTRYRKRDVAQPG